MNSAASASGRAVNSRSLVNWLWRPGLALISVVAAYPDFDTLLARYRKIQPWGRFRLSRLAE